MNILTLNKIAACGVDRFGAAYTVGSEVADPAGIMVRSAAMHDMEMPASLLAIARAGAGVNNIPLDVCTDKGIVVFNTPGANANAVKELVLAGLLLSSRKIVPAIEWCRTLKGQGAEVGKLVEKGKSAFAGPEILGKKLGVVGLGAIGVLVANAAVALGMDVYGYDPFLSTNAAWNVNGAVHYTADLKTIYENCDYITVHVPLNNDTREMFNAETFATMKDGVRILNFARGELVNVPAMKEALASGKVACYVVDFPCDDVLDVENVVAIPHLGASTPESEDNCAVMAADQLKLFLETGNIRNSVNFPNVEVPMSGDCRLCVLHRNGADVAAAVAELGLSVATMATRTRKDASYTIVDVNGQVAEDAVAKLVAVDGVLRVRKIG